MPPPAMPQATGRPPGRGPVYRLVRSETAPTRPIPTAEQRRVIDHARGRLRVLAGPGTGKTATIVEAVAARVEAQHVDPTSILVLTFSRRAAAELSSRLAGRIGMTVSQPLVRTMHSYAYALLREKARAAGRPPPRLLDAGQADLMVRDILAGHADEGGERWPDFLRPALRVDAFASELREFLLRTASLGMDPDRIAAAGRRFDRPEWIAAARFITEYRDIGDLRQASGRMGAALDQAELTTEALDYLDDPEALAAQHRAVRRIFVDEYQDVDPAQARLIALVADAADELVVVGDPDQAIYAFRGSQPGALQQIDVDETVALTSSFRMRTRLLEATRRVASAMPGPTAHRRLRSDPEAAAGEVTVRTFRASVDEAAFVADRLRRAHLADGVAWSEMAIVVRSPRASGDVLRRACAAAGVPVMAASAQTLASDRVVAALLTILRAGADPSCLTPSVASALLSSPLAEVDPLSMRRLRRALRSAGQRSGEESTERSSLATVVDILAGRMALPRGIPRDVAEPVRHIASLIAVARAGRDSPVAESVLWDVWEASGLVDRLVEASARGGRAGAAADSFLDSTIELFDRAADFADQLPSGGVLAFLDMVEREQIPGPTLAAAGREAVCLLSAHAAKGLEWDIVAVAGVQQDHWPDTRPRSSLLGLQALLDVDAGATQPLPTAPDVGEERRLFYVATTRARRHLIVTAVDDDDAAPSRFVPEIAGTDEIPGGWPAAAGHPRRGLAMPPLIADLRRAVSTGTVDTDRASRAARLLAELAADKVPGADPDTWYGLAPPSTTAPLVAPDDPVTVSPSQIESVLGCPLRSVLERHGGRPAPASAQLVGVAVHALAEGMAAGATSADIDRAISRFVEAQDHLAPWERARLRRSMTTMREALEEWIRDHAADRTPLGSETTLDVMLPDPDPAEPAKPSERSRPVRLHGRVDWLSLDRDGNVVITDFKTGSSMPTIAEAKDHAQLAAYQLAVALGAFDTETRPGDGESASAAEADHRGPGGAELVYLRSGRPAVRWQPAQSHQQRREWESRLHDAADSIAGAVLTARTSQDCDRCPVRSSCPMQPEGRQVTDR